MDTTPNTGNRTWAVISHLSALTFGIGIVLPILAWSDQRRKSNFASFQSLQALGYQSLGYTIWVLLSAVLGILFAVILLFVLSPNGSASVRSDQSLKIWMGAFFVIMIGLLVLYLVLPIIAAVACALGRDFRYPILGNRLARYLDYDPDQTSEGPIWLHEDHELRWVAAMGHFSILIALWGMLAPLTSWILHGKQSAFLRFQSIQTLAYQVLATVLAFVGGGMYMGGIFMLPLLFMSGSLSNTNSPATMIGLVLFIGFLLAAMLILLLVPLLHIQGQWAGYRVLKGDHYRYPLVGRLVDKWISRNSSMEEELV